MAALDDLLKSLSIGFIAKLLGGDQFGGLLGDQLGDQLGGGKK